MYESINDVPLELSEYYEDVDGVVLQLPRPEPKSKQDVERVLSLGKPRSVIDKFAELVEENLHWDYHDKYLEYLSALEAIEVAREEFVPVELEEGSFTEFVEPPTPQVPVKSTLTAEDIIEGSASYGQYIKQNGADVGGYTISLNESNQNGIASVYTGCELAESLGQSAFPISLRMENGKDFTTVPIESLEDFKLFAMEFLAKRQQFF